MKQLLKVANDYQRILKISGSEEDFEDQEGSDLYEQSLHQSKMLVEQFKKAKSLPFCDVIVERSDGQHQVATWASFLNKVYFIENGKTKGKELNFGNFRGMFEPIPHPFENKKVVYVPRGGYPGVDNSSGIFLFGSEESGIAVIADQSLMEGDAGEMGIVPLKNVKGLQTGLAATQPQRVTSFGALSNFGTKIGSEGAYASKEEEEEEEEEDEYEHEHEDEDEDEDEDEHEHAHGYEHEDEDEEEDFDREDEDEYYDDEEEDEEDEENEEGEDFTFNDLAASEDESMDVLVDELNGSTSVYSFIGPMSEGEGALKAFRLNDMEEIETIDLTDDNFVKVLPPRPVAELEQAEFNGEMYQVVFSSKRTGIILGETDSGDREVFSLSEIE